jgi:hypothetical protein
LGHERSIEGCRVENKLRTFDPKIRGGQRLKIPNPKL